MGQHPSPTITAGVRPALPAEILHLSDTPKASCPCSHTAPPFNKLKLVLWSDPGGMAYLAIFALCGTVALDIATIVSGLAGDPMWLFLGVAIISCAAMSREFVRASSRDLSSRWPSNAA